MKLKKNRNKLKVRETHQYKMNNWENEIYTIKK